MRATALIAPLLLLAAAAQADEGMWTFNRFPADQVQAAYGFKPDAAWLDRVRLASVRLAQGCSGSFVSGEGLVMTNHHCVHACVEQLSTPEQDRVAQGFLAKARPDEVKCPDLEVNQLVKITDVTDRIAAAVAGLAGVMYAPINSPNYHMGMDFLVLSFVVVVVGGMGSLPGAVLAGFLLGILESFASTTWATTTIPGINQIVIYLVAIIILLTRPRGLMGRKGVMED